MQMQMQNGECAASDALEKSNPLIRPRYAELYIIVR